MIKNKKGFTLIELLAVIVVLAIVAVLATTTLLPYMKRAREEAFKVEANEAINAASDAMSLVTIGEVSCGGENPKCEHTDATSSTPEQYCFTIGNLEDLGLYQTKKGNYHGLVKVLVSNNAYTYYISMSNGQYSAKKLDANDMEITPDSTNASDTCSEVTVTPTP